MTAKRADWGARYETLYDVLRIIEDVVEDVACGYDADAASDLVTSLADTFREAIGDYQWPETDFWTEWGQYKAWQRWRKEQEGGQ